MLGDSWRDSSKLPERERGGGAVERETSCQRDKEESLGVGEELLRDSHKS